MLKFGFDKERLNWDKLKLFVEQERGLSIYSSMCMRFLRGA